MTAKNSNLHDFTVKDAQLKDFNMSEFKGKVLLVVNVASRCGFTPQYKGLEQVYKEYKDQGLVIVGFPCNQFGAQEPGSEAQILEFCELNFGVSFPIMAKVDVNGSQSAPVFDFLKCSAPGLLGTEIIKWNFTKFLVGRDGQVIKRYAPKDEPKDIVADIKKALG